MLYFCNILKFRSHKKHVQYNFLVDNYKDKKTVAIETSRRSFYRLIASIAGSVGAVWVTESLEICANLQERWCAVKPHWMNGRVEQSYLVVSWLKERQRNG